MQFIARAEALAYLFRPFPRLPCPFRFSTDQHLHFCEGHAPQLLMPVPVDGISEAGVADAEERVGTHGSYGGAKMADVRLHT